MKSAATAHIKSIVITLELAVQGRRWCPHWDYEEFHTSKARMTNYLSGLLLDERLVKLGHGLLAIK
jgi:hypothetical protein